MLQRQLRVGDIVDDYCPRERRLSDHAIVAMVGETIRQTRCTTCDAEHQYKQAKVPVSRKKKPEAPLPPKATSAAAADAPQAVDAAVPPVLDGAEAPVMSEPDAEHQPEAAASSPDAADPEADEAPAGGQHEGPVHRRLIRATLPRIEGQEITRPIPEFTMHRVPVGRGGFQGKGFKANPGNQNRHGGRSAHGSGGGFGSRGPGGGHGQARGGNRPQGGHGGRHGQQGHGAGSGRRKKH